MKIGIDISQMAYQNTGVANYLGSLVREMVRDETKDFILFFSSLRRNVPREVLDLSKKHNVRLVTKKIPPTLLHLMWNIMHIYPIENFVGDIDLLITSDWSEPPTKRAKKATIIYDLIVFKHPSETAKKIVSVQKKKLSRVKKETDLIFCISDSTKNDVSKILGIEDGRLKVIYPGLTL